MFLYYVSLLCFFIMFLYYVSLLCFFHVPDVSVKPQVPQPLHQMRYKCQNAMSPLHLGFTKWGAELSPWGHLNPRFLRT